MKILHITATYPPSINGVAISTRRTVGQLRKMGHEVVLVAPKDGNRVNDEVDVKMPSLPNPIVKDYPMSPPLPHQLVLRKIQQLGGDIDVVHTHHPFTIGSLARRIAQEYSAPLVFTHHTRYADYSKTYAPFLPEKAGVTLTNRSVRSFCETCEVVVAPTRSIQEELESVIDTRVVTISTAGFLRGMRVDQDKKSLRKKISLPDKKILLTVTRVTGEKNVDRLVEIARKLERDFQGKYLILVVGGGPDLKRLRMEAKSEGLDEVIVFLGKIEQKRLKNYYSASDLFLYTTKTDTLGITLIEAMSAGLPIVAVEAANTVELINDQDMGRLVEDKVAAYVSSICEVMADEEVFVAMGKNSLEESRKYSITETSVELVELYEGLMK